jgi:hypothetical protein
MEGFKLLKNFHNYIRGIEMRKLIGLLQWSRSLVSVFASQESNYNKMRNKRK